MEENNIQKNVFTEKEVVKVIDHCGYGEYDSYHEWSPSYDLNDKVKFLEKLLDNRDITEESGKKMIVYFIRDLIKESKGSVLDSKLNEYLEKYKIGI